MAEIEPVPLPRPIGSASRNKYGVPGISPRTTSTVGDYGIGLGFINATTSFLYDPTNNLTQVTDADLKVTVYAYDFANRRLTTTYAFGTPDAKTWTVTYKPLGQVLTLTKPNGVVIAYSYEDRELLSQRQYSVGTMPVDTFTYHPNRLLATANGGLYTTVVDRSVLNTSYDMANRLIQERENIGAGLKTLAYQYTPDSLVSQMTYPGGTVAARDYTTSRLLSHTYINGGAAQSTFGYDTADRRSQRNYVNGVQTNWTLDANSRVTDLKHFVPGIAPVTLQEWNYGYANAGDPLSQNDVTPSYTVHGQAYQYDGLHQIDAFQRGTVSGNIVPSPAASQAWTLSKAGDWNTWATTVGMTTTTDTRTHNNIHALTNRSVVANPQLYDSNSNQTDDGANYLFVYDANDQLQQVQNRTTMAVIASYRYDALGRRVEKNLGSGTTVTQYYYAGPQMVEEHDDTGGIDTVNAFYTYGDYVDEPLTMDRPSGTRYYYHANRMSSTYLLTDGTGATAERYVYTPCGVATTFDSTYTTPQATSRVGNPYLFTGRELDGETLLYFYRARTYDPVQGRFKQLDPAVFGGGDWNLYRYVSNAPTDNTDAVGLNGTNWSTNIVAKSFINGVGALGTITPDRDPAWWGVEFGEPYDDPVVIDNSTTASRLSDLAKFDRNLAAFNENPTTDAKDGKYRLYTRAVISFTCDCDTLLNPAVTDVDKQGGHEAFILYGTINMSGVHIDRVDDSTVNVWWYGWGRPNALAEPVHQGVASRTSVNIWHQVDVNLSCSNGNGHHHSMTFVGSAYPSRRLWINGAIAEDIKQSTFSTLWNPDPKDPTWVAQ